MTEKNKDLCEELPQFIELEIVFGLITSQAFYDNIKPHLKLKYFNRINPIPGWCIEHVRKFGKVPGHSMFDIYQAKIRNGEVNQTKAKVVDHIMRRFDLEKQFDQEITLVQAIEWFRQKDQEEIAALFSEGNYVDTEKKILEYRAVKAATATKPEIFNGVDLMERELIDPNFLIPGIIPEGLSILAGKAKIGKSWLGLQFGTAIGCDGRIWGMDVEAGPVLYLALEDNAKRLQKRIEIMRGVNHGNLHNLLMANEWPRLDEGGLELLEETIVKTAGLRAIIIDCYKRIRGRRGDKSEYSYGLDYDELVDLKTLEDRYKISIILIHHTRKSVSKEDPFDEILGSTGIMAAVDAAFILKRERTKWDGSMWATGRDIQESQFAMRFDSSEGTWIMLGEAQEVAEKIKNSTITPERQEILDLLEQVGEMSPKGMATRLDKNQDTIRGRCFKMKGAGLLKEFQGKYSINK